MLRKRSYVCGIGFVLAFFAVVVGFSLTVGLFLQTGLGASLGVAILATLCFSTVTHERSPLIATQRSLVPTLGLLAVTFAVGWLLPRRADATR